jgi:thiamine pyrophosphate-dependent acetolactate synthase large subunit-like protein
MDIDPAELNKLRQAHIGLTGDLNALLPALQQPLSIDAWRSVMRSCAPSTPGVTTIRVRLSTRRCC